jgi:hypothetical protein
MFPRLAAMMLVASALLGCGSRRLAPNPLEVDRAEYDRLFQAAQAELWDRGFRVDRADYRFGKVESQPRPSPSIIEVWHPDNKTAYQAMESTVNHQRRIVTVTLEPQSPETPIVPPTEDEMEAAATQPVRYDTYLMRVEVMLEQKQVPSRQLTGSTRGERLQHTLHQVPLELRERGITGSNIESVRREPGAYWEPVGRDYYLEQDLLAAIVRRSLAVGLSDQSSIQDRGGARPINTAQISD